MNEPLRLLGPLGLALVAALAVDQLTRSRGLDPPGFAVPGRRWAAALLVALVLYLGVFLSLGQIGLPAQVDFEAVPPYQLFALHLIFLVSLGAWLLLGYAGYGGPGRGFLRQAARQVGLRAARPWREIAIGVGLCLLSWPVLLVLVAAAAVVVFAFGGEQAIPTEPPAMIVWIAALPVPLRIGVALSAGVVEELFFRGFLQPRVGVALSTLLFVLAHLSYDQPFMLVGITVLSFFFAGLVVWRQNVWAAITAHFFFDLVQLLIVIPWALQEWQKVESPPALLW